MYVKNNYKYVKIIFLNDIFLEYILKKKLVF